MTFTIFNSDQNEPECICCPVRDICETPPGELVTVTAEIHKRSGCNGGVFDTWEWV